jgi:hypothetical protein
VLSRAGKESRLLEALPLSVWSTEQQREQGAGRISSLPAFPDDCAISWMALPLRNSMELNLDGWSYECEDAGGQEECERAVTLRLW